MVTPAPLHISSSSARDITPSPRLPNSRTTLQSASSFLPQRWRNWSAGGTLLGLAFFDSPKKVSWNESSVLSIESSPPRRHPGSGQLPRLEPAAAAADTRGGSSPGAQPSGPRVDARTLSGRSQPRAELRPREQTPPERVSTRLRERLPAAAADTRGSSLPESQPSSLGLEARVLGSPPPRAEPRVSETNKGAGPRPDEEFAPKKNEKRPGPARLREGKLTPKHSSALVST